VKDVFNIFEIFTVLLRFLQERQSLVLTSWKLGTGKEIMRQKS